MSISTMPDRTTTQPDGTAQPEWGRSTELLAHEATNLGTFESVFPLWNSGDIDGLLDHYCDDVVWRNVAMGEVYDGKEAVRGFLERLFTALPDLDAGRHPAASAREVRRRGVRHPGDASRDDVRAPAHRPAPGAEVHEHGRAA